MFKELESVVTRPKPFEFHTTEELWTDDHISRRMLELHLNEKTDLASRTKEFIDRSSKWIIDHFELGKGRKVLDLGCGPGLYTTRFARSGAMVTGVDFSERSIQYAQKTAKEEGLDVRYIKTDYLELDLQEQFDLITLIFLDFCVLSPESRRKLLKNMKDHLKEGGKILIDLASKKLFDTIKEELDIEYSKNGGFWSASPYFMIRSSFRYDDEMVFLNKHTVIEKDRKREIYNWIQCYTVDSARELLQGSRFEIIDTFQNVAGDDYDGEDTQFALVIGSALP